MMDEKLDSSDTAIEALISRFEQVVSQAENQDPEGVEHLIQVAGLHDELTPTQQNALAGFMLDVLRRQLAAHSLDTLAINMLGLSDPYLVRSDFRTEARLVLGAAFRDEKWAARPFDEMAAVALAVIDLDFVEPGTERNWNAFFKKFENDTEHRDRAFDIALAGLSSVSAEAFAELINSQPFKDELADLFELYLPTLVRQNGRSAVQEALSGFLAKAPLARTESLRRVAAYHKIELHLRTLEPVNDVAPYVPDELTYAWRALHQEVELLGPRHGDETFALLNTAPRVILSHYIKDRFVDEYQNAVLHLVRELDPTADIHSQHTTAFAELPSDNTLPQPLIYAFPTYLTRTKEINAYAVFPFGHQRRLGVIFPRNSVLSPPANPVTTLSALLHAMVRNESGALYCLKNFAMSEIAQQAIWQDPDLIKHPSLLTRIVTLNPPTVRGSYVPREISNAKYERSSAFIFDLAGLDEVSKQVNARPGSAKSRRNDWLDGAVVQEISHDLSIPVGIGLNRYASAWAMEQKRWLRLREFAAEWANNPDFAAAMERLGVEIAPSQKVGSSKAPKQRPVLVQR